MAVVTMKNLLESGVHFGHQVKKWNPKMKKYIFTEKKGIHIIDLQKTIDCIKIAYSKVREVILNNKTILFVGTKKQAQKIMLECAEECGMHYINNRWLGGTLTNFSTIRKSLLRYKKLEKMEVDGTFDLLSKKEVSSLQREKLRYEKNFKGIKDMNELPGILFVIDAKQEAVAVNEAKKLGIPVIAVLDTNSDPTNVDYPIPGNDDAIRSVSLFTKIISSAVIEAGQEIGLQVVDSLQNENDEDIFDFRHENEKEIYEKRFRIQRRLFKLYCRYNISKQRRRNI